MKRLLPLAILAFTQAASASVCILSSNLDGTDLAAFNASLNCDGKEVKVTDDKGNNQYPAIILQELLNKGYKIVSQSGTDKDDFETAIWTLVK